jgi:hypothetical protein
LAQPSDQKYGRGISIQGFCTADGCDTATRAAAIVRSSLVEENRDNGMRVSNADATIEGVLVRGTLPRETDGHGGSGMSIHLSCVAEICNPASPATAFVRGSVVEENHDLGVVVLGSEATLVGLHVRSTLARPVDDFFGDGVSVASIAAPASATVTGSRVEASARAGLSNFGASVALGASVLTCNAFDLTGDNYREQPFHFENIGDNACGCPDPVATCKAQSVGLEPPEPLTDGSE